MSVTKVARKEKAAHNKKTEPPGLDKAAIDEAVAQVLRVFRQSRSRKPRRYNMKRAVAAFERMAGCVSHGSLAQNIDEELYGPMR